MNPKVSIIMPAYNSEATIGDAVATVIAQNYKSWELVIINDGSTDSTEKVAASFEDDRIRLITHINCGVAKSRNRGLEEASGELIAFLDADDLWLPDKLQMQVEQFAKGGERLGLAHHNYVEFGDFGERLPGHLKHCKGLALAGEIWQDLMVVNFIGTLSVMVKKEALTQVGGFDETLNGPEDWDLWIKVAKDWQIGYIPEPLALYRQHEGGISKDYRPYAAQILKVLERHLLAHGSKSNQARGLWLHNRHMAHGFARSGQRRQAISHFKDACRAKPMAIGNLMTALYVGVKKQKKEEEDIL
ncbi:MAG: glycosyltransferase family A protein [SAR324 cluster bacterium]|nr:glycosyltransferase family A protein [SAR324 cluster bacterium]